MAGAVQGADGATECRKRKTCGADWPNQHEDPNHHDAEEALGRGAVCQTFGDGNTWACIRDGDLWTCIAGGPNGRDILCAPAGIFGAGPERIPAGPVEVPR